MSSTNTTGAAVPVNLILKNQDGSTRIVSLSFKALNDRDIDELDEWVRGEFITQVRMSHRSDPGITDEEREREMAIAIKHASLLSWVEGEGKSMMATPKGMARIIYQHAINKSELSMEELKTAMFDPSNVQEVNRVCEYVNSSMLADLEVGSLSELEAKLRVGKMQAAKSRTKKKRPLKKKPKRRK